MTMKMNVIRRLLCELNKSFLGCCKPDTARGYLVVQYSFSFPKKFLVFLMNLVILITMY